MAQIKSKYYRAVTTYCGDFEITQYDCCANSNSYEWFVGKSKVFEGLAGIFQNNSSLEYNATAIFGKMLTISGHYGIIPFHEDSIRHHLSHGEQSEQIEIGDDSKEVFLTDSDINELLRVNFASVYTSGKKSNKRYDFAYSFLKSIVNSKTDYKRLCYTIWDLLLTYQDGNELKRIKHYRKIQGTMRVLMAVYNRQ
jgi:hypothetical protein